MIEFWRRFLRFFRRERKRTGPRFRAEYVPELPEVPGPWTVYLGRDRDGLVWGGALRCPCGCAETIHVNFVPGHDAVWRFQVHPDATVTLSPSVWRTRSCRSHFFIREGILLWVNDPPAGDRFR